MAIQHNYEMQRQETFASFKRVKNLPAASVVEFIFFLEETDANWTKFETELNTRGFKTLREKDGVTLVASIGPIPVTPEAIWEKERLSTEIALEYDFYPDGWHLAK
ncbi:MAG: hypothetical protein IT544_04095 [Rhodobacteraceae bacterium]|nr:hypothetical protein [Paracoccaceae bacterium]